MNIPRGWSKDARLRPYPQFLRPHQGRVIAGVAGGLSRHLGVPVLWVRLALLGIALFGGAGLVFYALVWVATRTSKDPELAPVGSDTVPRWLMLIVTLVVVIFGLSWWGGGSSTIMLAPLGVAGVGIALAWWSIDRGITSRAGTLSIFGGGAVLVAGIILFLFALANDTTGGTGGTFTIAIISVGLTLLGVAAIAVPAGMRFWDSLVQTQGEKIAAAERARTAEHLHDSVLQTLALIRKNPENSDEVARLARRQERELRQWLFGAGATDQTHTEPSTVEQAVAQACAEVEDLHGITIAPVMVGTDIVVSPEAHAAVLAAKEAMVNVAKHAGVSSADVYAEVSEGRLEIFVRDRGWGFDPQAIPKGHHGLEESVRSRIHRVGGQVRVRSAKGEGTEVAISVELPRVS